MSLLLTMGLGASGGLFSASLPNITNLYPATGSSITSSQTLEFNLTDQVEPFRSIIVGVADGALINEIAHNGSSFGPMYQGINNVRSSISGGYHYQLLRDGGWTFSPYLTPYAVDVSGSENP